MSMLCVDLHRFEAIFSRLSCLIVALDLERLPFLIIVPISMLHFLLYGIFSEFAYCLIRHPFVAGIANAIAFA